MTFDAEKQAEYAAQAKAAWGQTAAYREYEKKSAGRTDEENRALGSRMTELFREFGRIRASDARAPEAQALVTRLQSFITEHYYTCTDEILSALGKSYAAGGAFTETIDRAGGEGTALFAAAAIAARCEGA